MDSLLRKRHFNYFPGSVERVSYLLLITSCFAVFYSLQVQVVSSSKHDRKTTKNSKKIMQSHFGSRFLRIT